MQKKILCLVIPSLTIGGMERVMSELAGYFVQKVELELHLILYGLNPAVSYSLPENITIHKPAFVFNDNKRFLYILKTLFFLRKEVKQIRPYSILSFGEYWNSFVLLALLGHSFPVYISDRCQPDKDFGRFHTILRKFLYPRAKGIIAQTSVAKEIFQKQSLNRNIEVIVNPIRQILPDKNVKRENIILSVGRLIKTKHQDRLIKIFNELDDKTWKLIIVGGDALKQNRLEQLQKLVRELKLENRVVLTGEQNNIDDYYRRSKIFAFTSSSEGFPNVLGEALSAGLPVVSYDCVSGPSELITDGENGFLIPMFDDVSFKDKLQLLMKNDDLRNRISERAQDSMGRFSIQVIGGKYSRFILSEL